ncbi:TPA: potassium-transporting ATPase subunit KdpB [Serratia marcescens]
MTRKQRALFEPALVRTALIDAVKKLDPRVQWRNPVMFVVYIGSLLTTAIWLAILAGQTDGAAAFTGSVSLWLWFTVLFANFAEALAEGRSKAQAESLKGTKKTSWAKKLAGPRRDGATEKVAAESLRKGDIVLVEAGDTIPCDGEVLEGGASVDESAITGESAPVIRESGGDFSSVTGGTRVLSDWLVVQCSVNPGETFLDRMIAMVEGAKRRKTPNEIALTILLVALTIVFVLATATLFPFSQYSVEAAGSGSVVTITVLVALLVCLIPTTIGGLLSAIGVAGMSRMLGANVIATSGRAVEAAGDVDVLLLDKTGTITLGNRQASEFLPAPGVKEQELADAAQLASLADETPEGRSIVVLAKQRFNLRERDLQALNATFVPFSAQTRMSGVNVQERMIRKGAVDAIRRHVETNQGHFPRAVDDLVESVARTGGTPLVVAEGARVLGVVALKDIVKGGIKERFNELRKMGIKTVMITGDNPLTAAALAARHDEHWLVLDHLGKPDIARGARHWAQQIRPLAALPHVACKLSGLITEAPGGRWRAEELLPFFDAALEAFGPQRLMFGSDWPVCLLAGDYRQVVQLCERALSTLGAAEQAAIWGDTARRIYGLTESGYGSVSAR